MSRTQLVSGGADVDRVAREQRGGSPVWNVNDGAIGALECHFSGDRFLRPVGAPPWFREMVALALKTTDTTALDAAEHFESRRERVAAPWSTTTA